MASLGFCVSSGRRILHPSSKGLGLEETRPVQFRLAGRRTAVVRAALVAPNRTGADVAASAGAEVERRREIALADDGAEMGLPLVYDVEAIAEYWKRKPLQVQKRLWQVSTLLMPYVLTTIAERKTKVGEGDEEHRRKRAAQLRVLLTRLGPAYVKLGQGLSVRPDLVGPELMEELQQLCDAVPPFPNAIAMTMIEEELGRPVQEVFSEISEEPIAAASLGQVYRARLRSTGEEVAVKVQRPDMLRNVSLDLFVMRRIFGALQMMQDATSNARTEFIPLFDEWASGTFRELDYVNEGRNAVRFEEEIRTRLGGVKVPKVVFEATSRKILTTEWINGRKLADLPPHEVREIVGLGVQCFLTQLLDTGFFHADPHPGNLMVNEDGELVVLDFGLMSEVRAGQSDVFVAAIIHLGNRDYEAVVDDFVKLDFLSPDVDRARVVPVLGAVLDQALEGGGAKSINFQTLSSELSQITFDFPFKIPPYAALVIRALGVLEGIALLGDPQFKMIMEAFPFVSRRVMSTDTPMLREAFRDIVYKDGYFSAKRLQVLLDSSAGFLGVGDAFVDFDTPSSDPIDPHKTIEFLSSPDGQFIRTILAEEIASGVDVLLKSRRASFKANVPLPLRMLPGVSTVLNLIPELNDEDVRKLTNVREIIGFLADRQPNQMRLSASDLQAILPQLGRTTSEIVLMAAGQLSDRAVRNIFERSRSGGNVIAGRRRVYERTSVPSA